MLHTLTLVRNSIIHFIYVHILKRIFFRIDPETMHDRAITLGKRLGSYTLTRKATRLAFYFENPSLEQTILGVNFKNPIGLAAGFDKNAELSDILPSMGFGFAELGSITAKPYEGNPKPRLWRLPQSKGLAVWFGLKNIGAPKIAHRLAHKTFDIPIGISIAKTNCMETVDTKIGIEDYAETYTTFSDIGSYDTINISCPNTFGGQPFTDKEKLEQLLIKIQSIRNSKPLFIKLSPNLTRQQLDDTIALAYTYGVDGFICTNLNKPKGVKEIDGIQYKGGLSGKLVNKESNELIRYVYQETNGDFVLVGVGGVFSAEDAYKKIRAGASLIQLITGMIYEGPQLISEINRALTKLIKKDGFSSISEAIGADYKN